jgi:hypothetical protein
MARLVVHVLLMAAALGIAVGFILRDIIGLGQPTVAISFVGAAALGAVLDFVFLAQRQ